MSGRFRRAVASVVACALVGGVALMVSLPGAKAADTDHWASGVYPGPCKNISDQNRIDYVNQLRSFGSWRNHPVEVTMQFAPYIGTTNWLTNEEPNALLKCAVYVRQQLRVPMIFAIPMLPQFDTEDATDTTAGNPTLSAGANGDYNQYWAQLAQNLVDRGLGDTTLRIGWEFNGNWFRWAAYLDPSDWVKYWRNIVTTMRAVSPALKFDYSVALGSTYANPFSTTVTATQPGVYPGDQYVDVISASMYDQWFGQPACNDVRPAARVQDQAGPLGQPGQPALRAGRAERVRQGAQEADRLQRVGPGQHQQLQRWRWRRRRLLHAVVPHLADHGSSQPARRRRRRLRGLFRQEPRQQHPGHDRRCRPRREELPAGAGALQVVLGGTDSLALRVGPPQRGHPDRAGELIPATELVAASVELVPDADAQFDAEHDPDSEAGPRRATPRSSASTRAGPRPRSSAGRGSAATSTSS